jgi:hypothetical protein
MCGKAFSESIECNISTHEHVQDELEFDQNNPHVLTVKEVWKLMVPEFSGRYGGATLVLR